MFDITVDLLKSRRITVISTNSLRYQTCTWYHAYHVPTLSSFVLLFLIPS